MGTLAEIEQAADSLSVTEKRELLLFLATRLRGQDNPIPAPRKFSAAQIQSWIEDDEAALRQLRGT